MKTATFNYVQLARPHVLPFLKMDIGSVGNMFSVIALVDSGASTNLLPYRIGQRLGFDWENAEPGPKISGTISSESRLIKTSVKIGSLDVIDLSFCWIEHDNARLLLGQNDFFMNFTVCFLTKERKFSVFQD
jgi:gag-polyprotein putative aspartyl protease